MKLSKSQLRPIRQLHRISRLGEYNLKTKHSCQTIFHLQIWFPATNSKYATSLCTTYLREKEYCSSNKYVHAQHKLIIILSQLKIFTNNYIQVLKINSGITAEFVLVY